MRCLSKHATNCRITVLNIHSERQILYRVVGKKRFDWLNTVKLDGFRALAASKDLNGVLLECGRNMC